MSENKKKIDCVRHIPAGIRLNGHLNTKDMVYFHLLDGKYEGHIEMSPTSAECQVFVTLSGKNDEGEEERLGIGTWVSNLFPFDECTIAAFLDMAISETKKAVENGTASVHKDGDRVYINPNLGKRDKEEDEDIRW